VCRYNHIEETLVSKESAGMLHQAINSLPVKRRRIFMLCKLDGKSYDEVSRQLGISTSTISDHIVKANLFIRSYMLDQIL
jgi:RNA polymerase sigma-70 factor (ECF subfamily)